MLQLISRTLLASTILLGLSACTKGDSSAGQQQAKVCMMCHQSGAFTSNSEAELRTAISSKMNSGTHPSVGQLSKQDIADLAAFLSAPN